MALAGNWGGWAPALVYATGAMLTATGLTRGWRTATLGSRVALAAGATSLVLTAIACVRGGCGTALLVPATMIVLITFLGWIVSAYARNYLRGEPGQHRFIAALQATLAAVCAVIEAPNLAILIAAWAASSLGLHHLLTFYPERPAALVVAHKKFLTSRLAELLLVAAAVLILRSWGTLDIDTMTTRAAGADGIPVGVAAAVVLICIAVALKCALLPLHGWLIQVMEAPTPTSALLHAGIVNLGGYVLIRLAPLIDATPGAQILLTVVGALTATIGGLVMLTRVTIKVRLAWSTCSQMGFMVMECGLGWYDLAFLHLVAHSLYKAHAFLTSGTAVREAITDDLTASPPLAGALSGLALRLAALGLSLAITGGAAALWRAWLGMDAIPPLAVALLAAGLAMLLWSPLEARSGVGRAVLRLTLLAQCYFLWHRVLPAGMTAPESVTRDALQLLVAVGFGTLYFALGSVRDAAAGAGSSLAYEWAYGGLYLDERVTRLAFRLWPIGATGTPLPTATADAPSTRSTQ